MGPVRRSSTTNLIEGALEETITLLSRSDQSPSARKILIEARRLRSMVASWRAIPPRPDARKEVFANVAALFEKAGFEPPRAIARVANTPPSTPFQRATAARSTPGPKAPLISTLDDPLTPIFTPAPFPAFRDSPVPDPNAQQSGRHERGLHAVPSLTERRTNIAQGITLVRPDVMEWRPFPFIKDVSVKILHRDAATGLFRAVIKMGAGSALPRHRHAAKEETFIASGWVVMSGVEVHAGMYVHAEAGSVHESMSSPEGCTLFIVGSEHDELLGPASGSGDSGDPTDTI